MRLILYENSGLTQLAFQWMIPGTNSFVNVDPMYLVPFQAPRVMTNITTISFRSLSGVEVSMICFFNHNDSPMLTSNGCPTDHLGNGMHTCTNRASVCDFRTHLRVTSRCALIMRRARSSSHLMSAASCSRRRTGALISLRPCAALSYFLDLQYIIGVVHFTGGSHKSSTPHRFQEQSRR
jgi:hypothetical protein